MEAVFSDEVEIPSFIVLLELGEANGSKHVRPTELHQRKAPDNIVSQSVVSKRLKKALNKMNCSRELKEGDLVLKRTLHKDPRGKWTSNCEGSYAVKKVFSDGALIITTMNGEGLPLLVNSDAVNGLYA
ncbi:hypothetical protein QL285_033314 [Trifolium repens]|nr:hypothetical protein QL285_033314 [Trifolium repens]